MLPAPTTIADSTPRSGTSADLRGDPLHRVGVGAVVEPAHQGLARQLQQDAVELGLSASARDRPYARQTPTRKWAKRATRTFSPVFAASSARSSSIDFASCSRRYVLLLEQRDLLAPLRELALDDLLDYVLGLALLAGLGLEHPALGLPLLLGDLLRRDVAGARCAAT